MTCYTEYRLYLFNKQIPCYVSPESRRNSGGRVLSIFKAAIFVFNGSGTVGRKRNLYQGGGRRSTVKNKEGGMGGGGVKITFLTLPLPLTPTGTLTPNQTCRSDKPFKTIASLKRSNARTTEIFGRTDCQPAG